MRKNKHISLISNGHKTTLAQSALAHSQTFLFNQLRSPWKVRLWLDLLQVCVEPSNAEATFV